jgi:hypothetical protein
MLAHFEIFFAIAVFVIVAVILVGAGATTTGGGQINVEYFFRLIYNCFHGGCNTTVGYDQLVAYLSHLWLILVYVGYALSALGLGIIVYLMVRLFDLREREEHLYGTLILAPEDEKQGNLRWQHIEELVAGSTPSGWREAIIEADIMLHEALTAHGFQGESIAEKLRTIDQADLGTLQNAWEAHRVRNQIAHQGSAFNLSQALAQRTIQQYESVFREFGII